MTDLPHIDISDDDLPPGWLEALARAAADMAAGRYVICDSVEEFDALLAANVTTPDGDDPDEWMANLEAAHAAARRETGRP